MNTETIIIVLWLYIGMYSYVYYHNKIIEKFKLRWHYSTVGLIPMMGIGGLLTLIIMYLNYKERTKRF